MEHRSECFEEIVDVVARRMLPGGGLRDLFELYRDGGDVGEIWDYANEEGVTREVFAEACSRVAGSALMPDPPPGECCWECSGCGWQLLDPQLDLAAAVCLCGAGAGTWRVGTVRLPRSCANLPVAGEIHPLGSAQIFELVERLEVAGHRAESEDGENPVVAACGEVEGLVNDHAVRCEDGPEAQDDLAAAINGVIVRLAAKLIPGGYPAGR